MMPFNAKPLLRPGRLHLATVEHGAASLEDIDFLHASGCSVLSQTENECPGTLAVRVLEHIARTERAGDTIDGALIVLAARDDAQSMAARELIARSLAAHTGRGSRELVLLLGENAPASMRQSVLDLVERLIGEVGASLLIRIRFGTPSRMPASRTPLVASRWAELVR